MIRTGEPIHRVTLDRRDMIIFEQRLRDAIGSLFAFKSYSIHFPRNLSDAAATWIAAEKKLLLPLCDGKQPPLGVFVARGLSQKAASTLIPLWPALSALIADNLLLYKRSICDPVTGLFSRHYLLLCLEREIEILRDPIRFAPPRPGASANPASGDLPTEATRSNSDGLIVEENEGRRSSIGTLAVRLASLRDVVREFGYQFADELMKALADALRECCPEQAVAARTGDSEFAVHLPSASPKACRDLAADILEALRKVYVIHPLRREQVGIAASVGYTVYPQDMTGELFIRPATEQARVVLRKARLASALAGEHMPQNPGRIDPDSVMGFSRILAEGGRVLEPLPLSRVLISLGGNVHAREGQRFSVWSAACPEKNAGDFSNGKVLTPLYKGEIVIMEVHDNVSQAEVIHLGEPSWDIEPGDMLVLLPEEQGSRAPESGGAAKVDAATGLLRHGDFLARWAEEREKSEAFALAMVRIAPRSGAAHAKTAMNAGEDETRESAEHNAVEHGDDTGRALSPHPAHFMAQAVRLCREELGGDAPGGRYGLNSLIFFHSFSGHTQDKDAENLKERYEKAVQAIEERLGLDAAVGIALHPYLDFRKADALENARKALEYAMLLPRPHVGLLDSLALNISADKRFSQGDTFGAIKEYQLALLADEGNGMAWNSLGICLAGLNRHAEAEGHFSRALQCNEQDAMALYNLGYMRQRQGQDDEARLLYRRCLEHEPDHLYARVRLGQIAESTGNIRAAREFYEGAAILPGGESVTYRHFARLCISEGKADEAREHLHEALLYDPQDALAMALLARLYLDAGEDPEMAATLARQSVSLRPELKSGWLQLARAMEAQGRDQQAREARLKAGEI
ncbi:diguanylate cyclase [Desulfovibrio sp. OttesenSCG-928-M16]|nr:diguanylate cyclase [Desulfovibrio sp. OttesenSCG-928-M16]